MSSISSKTSVGKILRKVKIIQLRDFFSKIPEETDNFLYQIQCVESTVEDSCDISKGNKTYLKGFNQFKIVFTTIS